MSTSISGAIEWRRPSIPPRDANPDATVCAYLGRGIEELPPPSGTTPDFELIDRNDDGNGLSAALDHLQPRLSVFNQAR